MSISPTQTTRLTGSVDPFPVLQRLRWRSLSVAGFNLAGFCGASIVPADFSHD
jgi:hypothetical protein